MVDFMRKHEDVFDFEYAHYATSSGTNDVFDFEYALSDNTSTAQRLDLAPRLPPLGVYGDDHLHSMFSDDCEDFSEPPGMRSHFRGRRF